MKFNYEFTEVFKKQLKTILKKHRSIKTDLKNLALDYENEVISGVDLGNGYKKLRLKISSTQKGKSSGARVIFKDLVICENEKKITYITIYLKSDTESVSIDDLTKILKKHTQK